MKIVLDYPPNIEEIRKAFTLRDTVCFTYGNIIYNPGGGSIDAALMAHEETHRDQQMNYVTPGEWWDKYLKDPEFRLNQEVEAYQNQYRQFIKTTHDRNKIFKFVHRIAGDLASPLYGGVVDYFEATRLIKS